MGNIIEDWNDPEVWHNDNRKRISYDIFLREAKKELIFIQISGEEKKFYARLYSLLNKEGVMPELPYAEWKKLWLEFETR